MRLRGFLGLVAALAVASSGCAEDSTDGSTTLYFLTADGSAPIAVRRAGTLSAAEVLQQLLAGPTSEEHDRGITTAFPEDVKVRSLRVERGDARMDFSGLPQTSSAVERFRIITQLTKTLVGRSGIAHLASQRGAGLGTMADARRDQGGAVHQRPLHGRWHGKARN
jgi:hypothetical protein